MEFGFVIAHFGLFLREIAMAAQVEEHLNPLLAKSEYGLRDGLIVLGFVVLLTCLFNHQRIVEQLKRAESKLLSRGPSAQSFA